MKITKSTLRKLLARELRIISESASMGPLNVSGVSQDQIEDVKKAISDAGFRIIANDDYDTMLNDIAELQEELANAGIQTGGSR